MEKIYNEYYGKKDLRFIVKTGKFGCYFYDNEAKVELSLQAICDLLNTANRKFKGI